MAGWNHDEEWHVSYPAGHQYEVAMERVLSIFRHPFGQSRMLVIGSPLAEAVALSGFGWHVRYLDIRVPPPMHGITILTGNVMAMLEVETASCEAVSSTCVLCHVGTGRYGDAVVQDGDLLMMREISRVLVPQGLAHLMVGPVGEPEPINAHIIHRLYQPGHIRRLATAVRLTIEEVVAVPIIMHELTTPDYLCATLRKS